MRRILTAVCTVLAVTAAMVGEGRAATPPDTSLPPAVIADPSTSQCLLACLKIPPPPAMPAPAQISVYRLAPVYNVTSGSTEVTQRIVRDTNMLAANLSAIHICSVALSGAAPTAGLSLLGCTGAALYAVLEDLPSLRHFLEFFHHRPRIRTRICGTARPPGARTDTAVAVARWCSSESRATNAQMSDAQILLDASPFVTGQAEYKRANAWYARGMQYLGTLQARRNSVQANTRSGSAHGQ